MSIADEIYYETHEEDLIEAWRDYLTENGITEDELSLADFRDMV